jgi:hypothetical protein
MMMKIAPEAAAAQTISITITLEFGGAKIPKLMKMITKHEVTAINRGIDIELCSDTRNIS